MRNAVKRIGGQAGDVDGIYRCEMSRETFNNKCYRLDCRARLCSFSIAWEYDNRKNLLEETLRDASVRHLIDQIAKYEV